MREIRSTERGCSMVVEKVSLLLQREAKVVGCDKKTKKTKTFFFVC